MVISSAVLRLLVQNIRTAAAFCLPLREHARMSCILTDVPY